MNDMNRSGAGERLRSPVARKRGGVTASRHLARGTPPSYHAGSRSDAGGTEDDEVKNLLIAGESLGWLLASATDAMLIMDGDGRIVLANPALERMFGHRAEEMLGQAIEMLVPARYRHAHQRHRGVYNEQPRPRAMGAGAALSGLHQDGREFPVEVSLSPLRTSRDLPLVLATIHDITQRKLAEQALQQSQEELRGLAAHQENIKEQERKRIAQEIHDELGGLLTGIKAYISVSMERAAAAGAPADPLLADAAGLAQDAIATVRRVITDLRPSVLDQLGVWAALEWYAGQVEQRAGLHCDCRIDAAAAAVELDAGRSTMLFRIVQEALTNVVRHADASQVSLHVSREDGGDGGALLLRIVDDGKGIAADGLLDRESWGILGMHERSRHYAGALTITGSAGQGTTLQLRLPLKE